jgi:hypothetical protein
MRYVKRSRAHSLRWRPSPREAGPPPFAARHSWALDDVYRVAELLLRMQQQERINDQSKSTSGSILYRPLSGGRCGHRLRPARGTARDENSLSLPGEFSRIVGQVARQLETATG